MSLDIGINIVIIMLALWTGLASLIAAIRLGYRPLIYQAILLLIMAVPFILDSFVRPWQRPYSFFVFIPTYHSRICSTKFPGGCPRRA